MAGRPSLAALALPLLLLLAGCTGPGGGTSMTGTAATTSDLPPPPVVAWTPLPCDRSGATQTAIDVQLVSALRGEAAAVAQQIGQAIGDPVTGEPAEAEDTGAVQYRTRTGVIALQVGKPVGAVGDVGRDDTFQGASYFGNATWGQGSALQLARSLGAASSSLRQQVTSPNHGRVWQEWSGRVVYGAIVSWTNATGKLQVGIGPLFDFQAGHAAANATKAGKDAEAYIRCYLDERGNTAAKGWGIRGSTVQGFGVANRTLAYMVHVRYGTPVQSPCGEYDARWVYVDAWTGAVKAMAFASC